MNGKAICFILLALALNFEIYGGVLLDTLFLSILSGLIGLTIGFIVGYYKSRAEFTEKLGNMVSEANCEKRTHGIKDELSKGSNAFEDIKRDISSINTRLTVLQTLFEKQVRNGSTVSFKPQESKGGLAG